MKLEVGMFVRTPLGIDKIIKKRETTVMGETCYLFYLEQDHNLFYTPSSYFSIDSECFDVEEIKASYNIIDLIEEGDYVNGERVGYIDNCEGAMREYYYDYEDVAKDCGHWFEEIKSIVTKEQFSSMEYKVGE